jgi:predicted nucleic acid-binding protein
MYLVDTSIWLDFFRNRSTQAVIQFEEILDHNLPFGITSVIYQEVLQGADSLKDFMKLQDYLATQKFYHPLDPILSYEQAALRYFNCRRQGITIRGTIDCLIAQIAIEHNLRLLHSDRDFTQMATVNKNLKLA